MEFSELIKKRRSIRAFKKKEIPEELLIDILEMVLTAPSAGNLQSYKIIIVKDDRTKELLADAAWNQNFIMEAPINIVFCADMLRALPRYGKRGAELYCIQDATIATTYFLLAAYEKGLATVWVGAFDEEEIREILKLPNALRPISIVPIGYPNEYPSPTPRRSLKELILKYI